VNGAEGDERRLSAFAQIRWGAGEGTRTPNRPITRSADPGSPQVSNVSGLREHACVIVGGRRRTGVNETETETTSVPDAQLVAAAMTPAPPRLLVP
jgi:hypothetical protein